MDVNLVERKSSPTLEDPGASLAQLLWQHEKVDPTPYSDENKQKADNCQQLLAQYKCPPFIEEITTPVPPVDAGASVLG